MRAEQGRLRSEWQLCKHHSAAPRPDPPLLAQVVYFVNSGSEANDMAMMMARAYTGHSDMICLRNAYHGARPPLTSCSPRS